MRKVVIENLTFNGKKRTIYYTGHKNFLGEHLFYNFHRYHGNHILGHGISKGLVYSVSRKDDEELQDLLNLYKNNLETLKQNIDEIELALTKPYVEVFEDEIEIGSLPDKEELIKEGHYSVEQIEEAFKRIDNGKS